MSTVSDIYNYLLFLKEFERAIIEPDFPGIYKEQDQIKDYIDISRIDELRRKLSMGRSHYQFVKNEIANLKEMIQAQDLREESDIKSRFFTKTPLIDANNKSSETIRRTIVKELKLIDSASMPLAFDIISLNSNLDSLNKIFDSEEIISAEKIRNIIMEFKTINFEWLDAKVNSIYPSPESPEKYLKWASRLDTQSIFLYLDVSSIFANLANLRKSNNLTRQGLEEMSTWVRSRMKETRPVEFIHLLTYYLQELQATFEYFNQAAILNKLTNYWEDVRGEFR